MQLNIKDNSSNREDLLKQRFLSLPKIVQEAIVASDVQQQLRVLAETHKLHLDQWEILENEVMMTILGFTKANELENNLIKEVGIEEHVAQSLTADINTIVFEPVRKKLEEFIAAPATGDISSAAPAPVERPSSPTVAPQPVLPGTPPAPAPTTKVIRAPISESYSNQTPSISRKSVMGDPYREQLL